MQLEDVGHRLASTGTRRLACTATTSAFCTRRLEDARHRRVSEGPVGVRMTCVVITPDPASKSGRGVRTIGWSHTANRILTVITLVDDDRLYGVNGWVTNSSDQRAPPTGGPR